MATETTRLLGPCIVDLPGHDDEYGGLHKTKGLSLEELMPFQDDPWWQNIRKTFFLSFWLTLIVVFVAACTLSIMQHGACPAVGAPKPAKDLLKSTIGLISLGSGSSLSVGNNVNQTLEFQ